MTIKKSALNTINAASLSRKFFKEENPNKMSFQI